MTINALIKRLQALVADDEYRGEVIVTYGSDDSPVEGGIIAREGSTGLIVLNLARIKLDQVGGF